MYTGPGMKDFITVYENGKKKRLRKHYLTMYLRETHSIFVKANLDNLVSQSWLSQSAFTWRRFGVFIVNFELISNFVLVFLLLILNR